MEESKMANSLQYVREQMDLRKVGNGTTIMDIVLRYTPGAAMPVRVQNCPCPDLLSGARFILQLMEEYKNVVDAEAKERESA
jgi:hypothetical protein